ncbi:MAG: formimidoylglutamase [Bacteroidetes bacterium]|nr:formimidoylglutamase [Bacteroidota bacterium]
MLPFKYYTLKDIKERTRSRYGECKVGDVIACPPSAGEAESFLQQATAPFVLIGIPEDIGVRANLGRPGAHTAWKPAVENILNLQSNDFLNAKNLLVLGEVELSDLMQQAQAFSSNKNKHEVSSLRKLVELIDARVAAIIEKIVAAKKIPIVVGGGHNNAYPIIKATNETLRKENKTHARGINVLNCDAHADFRALEGRHSGNGFSYAFEEGALAKYAVLGLHEQYNAHSILQKFNTNKNQLLYKSYEDIFLREKETFAQALDACIDFCKDTFCGVEIDLDAITNVPSSARTSCGISPLQARQYVYNCAKKLPAAYLHIPEGAPVLAHLKADNKTGKLIAYLVSDFIKGFLEK